MAAKMTTEAPLLPVKVKTDTSPTETYKPTFIFQSEEQIAKTMPVELIRHLLPEAEYYFICINILPCLILMEQENQLKHYFIFLIILNVTLHVLSSLPT